MNYFYVPQLTPKHEFVMMPEDEARHAIKVLRMRMSDPIVLLDGNGGKYTGVLYNIEQKRCEVRVDKYELQERPVPQKIHLGISPTKNSDRIELLVEKAVEIGVNEISFLQTHHSERKALKLERIKKIAVAAMKQSGNLYLPKINDMQLFRDFVGKVGEEAKYLAYVPAPHTDSLAKAIVPKNACLLVGAEGGFSDDEAAMAQEKGFVPVSLSPHRLRTETAGIVGVHTLQLMLMSINEEIKNSEANE